MLLEKVLLYTFSKKHTIMNFRSQYICNCDTVAGIWIQMQATVAQLHMYCDLKFIRLGQNRGSISRDDPVLLLVILVYANMSHFTLPYQCDQLHKARARPHRNCDGQYSCIALTSLQPSLQLPQAVAWHQTGELHCVRLWAGACPCSSQSSTKSVTLGRKGCVCARDYQHLDLKEPRHL